MPLAGLVGVAPEELPGFQQPARETEHLIRRRWREDALVDLGKGPAEEVDVSKVRYPPSIRPCSNWFRHCYGAG